MHPRRSPFFPGARLAALVVVLTAGLTACGGAAPAAGPASAGATAAAGGVGASPSRGSSDGASPAGGPGAGAPTGAPTSARPSGGTGGSSRCLSGAVRVLYPGSGRPAGSLCVHTGTRITITLRAEPGAPWRAVVTSAPQVVTLTADAVTAGGVEVSARAAALGTATLSATTRPLGDPGGAATKHWELTLTVVP